MNQTTTMAGRLLNWIRSRFFNSGLPQGALPQGEVFVCRPILQVTISDSFFGSRVQYEHRLFEGDDRVRLEFGADVVVREWHHKPAVKVVDVPAGTYTANGIVAAVMTPAAGGEVAR